MKRKGCKIKIYDKKMEDDYTSACIISEAEAIEYLKRVGGWAVIKRNQELKPGIASSPTLAGAKMAGVVGGKNISMIQYILDLENN